VALIVLALGVLPFLLDGGPIWQLLGPLVAGVMLARSAQLVRRAVFSTDPTHVARH
jgi:hypothetical protein